MLFDDGYSGADLIGYGSRNTASEDELVDHSRRGCNHGTLRIPTFGHGLLVICALTDAIISR